MTPAEVAQLVCGPGYMARPAWPSPTEPSDWRPITVVAVIWQESGGNPQAVGRPVYVERYGWGVALGLCQLLSQFHVDRGPYPDVPAYDVAACFDPEFSWARMWLVMNRNRPDRWRYNLTPWTAYTTGAYRKHLPLALEAVRSLGSADV